MSGRRWIPGHEDRYAVTPWGEVWSAPRTMSRGGVLSQRIGRTGYPEVRLSEVGGGEKTYRVHRLVALTFIGPCPEGYEVRHLDGDRLNPRVENLAYGTRSENTLDKRAHGTDPNVNKTHCPQGHPYEGDNVWTSTARPGSRHCLACAGANARRWANRKNAETRAKATRSRSPWTEEESRIALDPTITTEHAAELTGRSLLAVMSRRLRLRKVDGFDSRWVG